MRLLDWTIQCLDNSIDVESGIVIPQPEIVAKTSVGEIIYRVAVFMQLGVRYKVQVSSWHMYGTNTLGGSYSLLHNTDFQSIPTDMTVNQLVDSLIEEAEGLVLSPMDLLAKAL